jgi:hypothetical protein
MSGRPWCSARIVEPAAPALAQLPSDCAEDGHENLALHEAGAELVSVSENIDQTGDDTRRP